MTATQTAYTRQTLTTGQTYDVETLFASHHVGWTGGDGHYDSYDFRAYFDPQGRYLGPDQDGVEPLVEAPVTDDITSPPYRRRSDGRIERISDGRIYEA